MKLKMLFVALVVALVLVSCVASGPDATAKKFIIALSNMDWDEATKLSTEDGAKVLEMLKSFTGMMTQEQLDQSKKKISASDITIVSSKTDGDEATVVYKVKGEDKENTLDMKKVGGQWKVNYSKNF
jgi:hypothetical protein